MCMAYIVGGMAMEMQKKRSLWGKIKNIINGAVENEIPVYGRFEIGEDDGYDVVKIKLDKDVPLDSLQGIIDALDLEDEDVWFNGEVRLYV